MKAYLLLHNAAFPREEKSRTMHSHTHKVLFYLESAKECSGG